MSGQKPIYAGRRGQGYKDALLSVANITIDRMDEIKSNKDIQDKTLPTTTTVRPPLDAKIDANYLHQNKIEQPYWLMNQKAFQDIRSKLFSVLNHRVLKQKAYYLGLRLNKTNTI